MLAFAGLGVGALALTPLLGRAELAAGGFVLSGLFLSGMFPMIMAVVDRLPARYTSLYLVVWASSVGGGALMSRAVGGVVDAYGLRAGMLIGAVPLLLQLLVTLRFGRVLDAEAPSGDPAEAAAAPR